MAQGQKFGKNKIGKSCTQRKAHVNVRKQKKSNGTQLATKKINKGLETLLAQAASGPSSGTAMTVVKLAKNAKVTSIKGNKIKSLRVSARPNKS